MEQNLNHISRLELLDTLKLLSSGSGGALAIADLLGQGPLIRGSKSDHDLFNISTSFSREMLEDIAYAVEQYAFDQAAPFVEAVEDGNFDQKQERSFQYWQILSERWSYLELMR